MKKILTLLLLLIAIPANADSYTYENGYYWSNGRAYSRTLYTQPGYYYCNTYYPSYNFYKYTPVQITYNTPDWRTELLKIAAARDKFEGEIRKSQFEQQYFTEAVTALGLQGNFRWNNYGAYAQSSYGVANASTQYGYSYNSISQLYGTNDLNLLYQQANQLAQNAQRLSGQATTEFSGLVTQEGGNRARVAEIIAKGQMARQILETLTGSPEAKSFSFRIAPGGMIERNDQNVSPELKTKLLNDWKILAEAKCMMCHDPKTKKGNFDITTYPSLTQDIKQKIWGVLIDPDDKHVMPRTADGGPGKRLSPEELRLFFLN